MPGGEGLLSMPSARRLSMGGVGNHSNMRQSMMGGGGLMDQASRASSMWIPGLPLDPRDKASSMLRNMVSALCCFLSHNQASQLRSLVALHYMALKGGITPIELQFTMQVRVLVCGCMCPCVCVVGVGLVMRHRGVVGGLSHAAFTIDPRSLRSESPPHASPSQRLREGLPSAQGKFFAQKTSNLDEYKAVSEDDYLKSITRLLHPVRTFNMRGDGRAVEEPSGSGSGGGAPQSSAHPRAPAAGQRLQPRLSRASGAQVFLEGLEHKTETGSGRRESGRKESLRREEGGLQSVSGIKTMDMADMSYELKDRPEQVSVWVGVGGRGE